jgi:hypothetical protein
MDFFERLLQRSAAHAAGLDDGQRFMFHVLRERHAANPQVVAAGDPAQLTPAQKLRLYALFMEIERNEATQETQRLQQENAALRAQLKALEPLQPIRSILDQNASLQQQLVALGREHIALQQRAQTIERTYGQAIETTATKLRAQYEERLARARQRLQDAHESHLREVAGTLNDAALRDAWISHLEQVRLILEE